jgi:hypothetical protein
MAKQTSRTAWGLAAVLGAVVLGGCARLLVYEQQTGALTVRWRSWSDRPYWTIGKRPVVMKSCGPNGSRATLDGYKYGIGFVEVEVPYRGPEVVYYDIRWPQGFYPVKAGAVLVR